MTGGKEKVMEAACEEETLGNENVVGIIEEDWDGVSPGKVKVGADEDDEDVVEAPEEAG